MYKLYQKYLSRYKARKVETTVSKITDIPGEVLMHHVLPLLQPNDVARLRRVCKKLKSVADDHLRLHVRNNRILHIGGRYNERYDGDGNERRDELITMKLLLELNCHLPVTQFSLSYYFRHVNFLSIFENEKWKMQEFVDKYGKQITHLTISTFSVPMKNGKEKDFYEGLSSLTHLTIMDLEPDEKNVKIREEDKNHFPATFKQLKYLAVKYVNIHQENAVAVKNYFWTLVEFCANLETFVYPEFVRLNCRENENLMIPLSFQNLGNLLETGRNSKLKSYYLNSVSTTELAQSGGPTKFADFCKVCNQHRIKLHIENYLLHGLSDPLVLECVGCLIVSLMNLNIACLRSPLPNLETLVVYTDYFSSVITVNNEQTALAEIRVPEWPKLKRLTYYMSRPCDSDPTTSKKIFHIIFEAVRRPSVEFLEFWLPIPFSNKQRNVVMPSLRNVAWSCFNLRTVKIVSWNGTNEEISLFWGKLPLLEEICLLACRELGDSAFIGDDANKPVFFELKNLRKLSLLQADEMPKITDAVFKLVFRHLKLREFHITSWECGTSNRLNKIQSITKEGIKSLLTSDFAKSIERFPFDSWMLDDMNLIKFLKLRDRFRSSHMM